MSVFTNLDGFDTLVEDLDIEFYNNEVPMGLMRGIDAMTPLDYAADTAEDWEFLDSLARGEYARQIGLEMHREVLSAAGLDPRKPVTKQVRSFRDACKVNDRLGEALGVHRRLQVLAETTTTTTVVLLTGEEVTVRKHQAKASAPKAKRRNNKK